MIVASRFKGKQFFMRQLSDISLYFKRIPGFSDKQKIKQYRLGILLPILLLIFMSDCIAQTQYKITNNEKVFATDAADSVPKDQAMIVAKNFFSFIAHNNRPEWDKLLSSECFQEDGRIREKVNRYWEKLILDADQFNFSREVPAVKTNQKTYIFSQKKQNKKSVEKTLVLVKEHGKWKIFSIK
jgi:hypothetical protein